MSFREVSDGWLCTDSHAVMREILLHTEARHGIVCPSYCLMPDHAHFLWMGTCADSDQLLAARFFRRHWNNALRKSGCSLQKQAYDHVLNEHERNPSEFEDTMLYILRNPLAAGLVEQWPDWPFLGAVVSGYPELDPRKVHSFLEVFWTAYNGQTGE